MSQTFEKILEEVKALSAEERRYLMTVLSESNGSARSDEDEFQRRLAAEGWLSLPLQPSDEEQRLSPAAALSGRPLSEILIEERC